MSDVGLSYVGRAEVRKYDPDRAKNRPMCANLPAMFEINDRGRIT
jgi:hypothetical protein